MKKQLLTILLVAVSTLIMAQKGTMSPDLGNYVPSSRDNEFVCMPNAVFSQVAPALYDLYYCQVGQSYGWYLAADDYTASAPFTTLRIWGGDFYGCPLSATEPFDIKIWDGEPWDTGNLIYSATVNGTTSLIGLNLVSTDIYQIDLNLGTSITQLNGWIGVTRNNATCNSGFAWAFFNSGIGNSVINNGAWYSGASDMMMCLGNEAMPETPISNWALLIGLGLIVTFTIIRFRKIS